jgi:antitoxin VapB
LTDLERESARLHLIVEYQAARLPREFRVTIAEVEIFRRGDEIALREMPRTLALEFELLCELPVFNHHGAPQERKRR